MNFIEHFRGWVNLAQADRRLKAHHISLYIALFRYWNENRFRNPFTIFRHEIMALSKIGSVTTYTRSLRDLTAWNYIRYEPSFDPQVGSKVHLYRFDQGAAQANGKSSGKGTGQGAGKAGGQGGDTYNINIPNTLNHPNRINGVNAHDTGHENLDFVTSGAATPQSIDEARSYFLEIQSTAAEGEKFYNHFQSVGWRAGRAQITDWRAAARKWVANAPHFAYGPSVQPKPGTLNTSPKNYAEPL